MQYLKKLLDFYIQSSLHVGLALFSLVFVTAYENDVCRHITYPCCVLFGTILGYNFLKYFDVFRQGKFYKLKYYGIMLVCFLAVLGYLFFYVHMVDRVKIQLAFAGILVLAYPPLRKHGIVKMFWVSFVIALLTAFIFINALQTFKGIVALEFLKRFVFVSALMIPFEIYDSQHDAKTLNTLPQKFGISTAKKVGYGLLLGFVVLEVLNFKLNGSNSFPYLIIDMVIAFITGLAIYFSSLQRNQYYSSFWVESIPILWWVLLLIFK